MQLVFKKPIWYNFHKLFLSIIFIPSFNFGSLYTHSLSASACLSAFPRNCARFKAFSFLWFPKNHVFLVFMPSIQFINIHIQFIFIRIFILKTRFFLYLSLLWIFKNHLNFAYYLLTSWFFDHKIQVSNGVKTKCYV